ncbi:hypothetical protein KSP39_PZI005075 [Platanthera zijinensis]|uniref:ZCF37 n=1 Tax=Platanthera zijinensis TaxID=2320716 RepID=A0AAP0BSW1_9ASPA
MSRRISSIHHVDDDQSAPATPRSFRKKHAATAAGTITSNNTTSSSINKNPYSSRGLEKFTSVLSELEAKKEKIMTRIGSDVAMVRFKYTTCQDFIPIVVKIREDSSKKSSPVSPKPEHSAPSQPTLKEPVSTSPAPTPRQSLSPEVEKKVKKSVTWSRDQGKKRGELWRWRPSYYMLVPFLLVLVCLMVSGRVFAVCCTAVWWYLVPLLKGADQGSENTKRWSWKKNCGRKFGEKKLSTIAGGGSSLKKVGSGGV